ncbi:MAG: transporter substrate-binding domain-containing protein [Candidatus Delongbacteria bacterium]|nr:transporter substrate-binding domain-containing protein [Candidatus Delongbacteria bacterium]MBN2834824.1 transporter substrate-binding domain-containing protein [Candidatus Delongbacteria bacterium]
MNIFLILVLFSSILSEEIRFATGEYEPYTSVNMDDKGCITQIVNDVCELMNIQPEYEFFPWKRAERCVLNNNCLAAFPYSKTADREKDFIFTDVLLSSNAYFYYYRPQKDFSTFKWEKYEDLRYLNIGGVLGYWYESEFRNSNLNVSFTYTDLDNIRLLMMGRIDLMPANEIVFWDLVRKNVPSEANNFKTLPKSIGDSDFYLMLSKNNPDANDFVQKFNKSLAEYKKSNKYKALLKKYGFD